LYGVDEGVEFLQPKIRVNLRRSVAVQN